MHLFTKNSLKISKGQS